MDPVLEFIASVARVYPAVRKIYLFGSRAKGTQNDKSDYDFAFDWDQAAGGSWGEFAERLREESPVLNALDIILLDRAGAELRNRILTEGVVIYDKNSTNI